LSSKSLHKSNIIYTRLKEEYTEFANWGDFAKFWGISRQAINNRKNKTSIDYEEIRQKFPDVNKDWLYSDDENELKKLPVKNSFTNEENVPYARSIESQKPVDLESIKKRINAFREPVKDLLDRFDRYNRSADDMDMLRDACEKIEDLLIKATKDHLK
jgi:hypothetical protein